MNADDLNGGKRRMMKAKLEHEEKLLVVATDNKDNEAILKHQKNIKYYKDLLGE